jgi:hypothetical protein
MSRTKVEKELMSSVAVKIVPLYSKMTPNFYQSRTLVTLQDTFLPKLLSRELKFQETFSTL